MKKIALHIVISMLIFLYYIKYYKKNEIVFRLFDFDLFN